MTTRRRHSPLELKQQEYPYEQKRVAKAMPVTLTDGVGTFEGYGAVFDVEHPTSSWLLGPEWKDIIRPGAFKKTLAEHKKLGTRPNMLLMHEPGEVVGVWQSIEEDKDGLLTKGLVSLNAKMPNGAGVHELMKMGALTGESIGFQAQKVVLHQELKLRELLEVKVREVSIVDDPGGPTARITDVKSATKNPKFIERLLRDAGFSRKEAKALLAEGLSALRDAEADDDDDQREADPALSSTSVADFASSIRSFAASVKSRT
jgi:HK97 family phage prohead protease